MLSFFRIITNFYYVLGVGFIVWMLFFDAADWKTQYTLRNKLSKLEKEALYYQQYIEKLKKEQIVHREDDALLEKLAREKYRMKKKSEDLYIIVE